jgi:hypothetical protein
LHKTQKDCVSFHQKVKRVFRSLDRMGTVRNRQVVFPRGQRPQHIGTCTGENMQETP